MYNNFTNIHNVSTYVRTQVRKYSKYTHKCQIRIIRVLPRPSLVVVICFAQFSKTAAVYLSSIWAN